MIYIGHWFLRPSQSKAKAQAEAQAEARPEQKPRQGQGQSQSTAKAKSRPEFFTKGRYSALGIGRATAPILRAHRAKATIFSGGHTYTLTHTYTDTYRHT